VQPIAGCVDEAEQRTNGVNPTRADGYPVDALMYGSGDVGVVFANQVDDDLCSWQWHAQELARKGSRAIVFNYSNRSGAENDVLAAVGLLRQKGSKRIFLIGASKGGTAVLAAAAVANPAVNGVVSLSGPRAFGGSDAGAVMPAFATPVLFIAGDNDGTFTTDAQALFRACAEKDKQLILRPSARHGVGLVDIEVFQLIQQFMAKH
jgi:dienelactone hydrolase